VVPDDDPLRRKRAYFTVGRLTRELPNRSQVGIFYSDREMSAAAPERTLCDDTALSTTEAISCVTNSNRVGGADFTLRLGQHIQSYGQVVTSQNNEADGTHLAGNLYHWYGEYSTRHVEYNVKLDDVTSGFVTLAGFFQRPDIIHESQFGAYTFRPEGKILTSYGPQVFHAEEWDHEGNRLTWFYEPAFNLHFKANTDFQYFHGFAREQLRPADFSTLPHNVDWGKGYNGIFINSTYFKYVSFNGTLIQAKSINFDPPANAPPFLADEVGTTLTATVHPWSPLTIDNTYILERLTTRTIPARAIINGHIIRSNWKYQYNPRLGFRAIFQFNSLLRNPLFTDLNQTKNFNADFLVTYLIHPGTAFYLGYNSNLENLDPMGITRHDGLFRTNRSYINDGRVIFAKVSWLFRF